MAKKAKAKAKVKTKEQYESQPVTTTLDAIFRIKAHNLVQIIQAGLLFAFILILTILGAGFGVAMLLGDKLESLQTEEQALQVINNVLPGLIGIFAAVALFVLFILLPLSLALNYLLTQSQAKQNVSLQVALKRGFKRILPAIGAFIITSVLIIAGLILFVIPGLYIALRLAYINQVVANEDSGAWDSVKLAWQLSKNNLWDIVGVVSLGSAVSAGLSIVLLPVTKLINPSSTVDAGDAVVVILTILITVISIIGSLGIYLRYHQSKLVKAGKIDKGETHPLNYALLAAAVVLTLFDSSSQRPPTP